MSNQSQINFSSLSSPQDSEILSLDQLLDSLGFDPWKTITATIVIPSLCLIGIFLCSLSVWIFFQKNFKDPVFFYYRLLCFVYIIHLVHIIPFGFLYSPRYFTQINTYFTSLFYIYYLFISGLLFHFEETLQMAILLTRMKIYNSFVNKNFSSKPWVISLAFFLTCLFINISIVFSFKVESFCTFYSYDSNNTKRIEIYFYSTASNFSSTLIGKVILAFTAVFLNLLLSIIVGIILNVISLSLYRTYVRERREKENEYNRVAYRRNLNQIANVDEEIQIGVSIKSKPLTQKEINESKAESNMLKMALTLCSISILSRILFVCSYIFFYFFNSFSYTLTLTLIGFFIFMLGPTTALFVFYSFNKMFRKEFQKKLQSKEKSNIPNQR
jgi:hypothetical protein